LAEQAHISQRVAAWQVSALSRWPWGGAAKSLWALPRKNGGATSAPPFG